MTEHLFANRDDAYALSDDLADAIGLARPAPKGVMFAATYELARSLRFAPERYTTVMVGEMQSRMPIWIAKLRESDLPPLKLASEYDPVSAESLIALMNVVLERRQPPLGAAFDVYTELLCRVIVRCEDADIAGLTEEACDRVTYLSRQNHLLDVQRIDEDQWETRFGWVKDANGDCNLLSATDQPGIEDQLAKEDPHLIWSQVDDPDSDGVLVLPGFWPDATGWYRCERPWVDNARVIVEIELGRPEMNIELDPETAEVMWTYGLILPEDPDSGVGRVYYARAKAGDEWINLYDLPADIRDALRRRMDKEPR